MKILAIAIGYALSANEFTYFCMHVLTPDATETHSQKASREEKKNRMAGTRVLMESFRLKLLLLAIKIMRMPERYLI